MRMRTAIKSGDTVRIISDTVDSKAKSIIGKVVFIDKQSKSDKIPLIHVKEEGEDGHIYMFLVNEIEKIN